MSLYDELERLGETEVRRRLVNEGFGQVGSQTYSAVQEWLRGKEHEKRLPVMELPENAQALIFISYDTRDIELVRAIDDILKRVLDNKIKTFIAKRDIKAGDDAFKTMLHDNLSNSSVVLAICTKRSITSPWLWFESGAGFGSSRLIPLWAGTTPQEFKEPMKIFQGRNVEDKDEMEDLLTQLCHMAKIEAVDCSLSVDELNKLKQLCKAVAVITDGKKRLEEIIDFQMEAPNKVPPFQYLIEAHFPLSRDIPLQRLMTVIEKSKIVIKSTESSFSEDFPVFDARRNKSLANDVQLLNGVNQNIASNQVKQTLFIKSDAVTLTYWVRLFHWDPNKPEPTMKPIYGREINEEAVKFFLFYRRVAQNLKLSTMSIRIRLSQMQNGVLITDRLYFHPSFESFRAPESNDVEIERDIEVNNVPKQEYIELLMHLWETFRSESGKYPTLKEEDFSWLEDKFEL